MKTTKSILLIGLGRFGRHLAIKFHELNHEVLAIDKDENKVNAVLDYVTNQEDFKFVDGRVQLPVRPGLGVEVNKELVLEENKTPHQWKNPVWRHKDGSVAEW